MITFSVNDWEPLKEIIVGRADFAYVPPPDPSMKNFMYARLTYREISKYVGSYSDRVIDESNIDLGCYFSLSGIITFKNANKLRDTIKILPIKKIIFETDSPYLTPDPLRGKINKPSYCRVKGIAWKWKSLLSLLVAL